MVKYVVYYKPPKKGNKTNPVHVARYRFKYPPRGMSIVHDTYIMLRKKYRHVSIIMARTIKEARRKGMHAYLLGKI